MNARRENQIAWMLILGVAAILIGILVSILSFGAAMNLRNKTPIFLIALGPILIVGGIALIGYGVFSGHATNRKAQAGGVRHVPDCYVVGVYAINERGEMIFADYDLLDHPKCKFFVRLKLPDGSDAELECARELMMNIGEGMKGNAQIKGRWLGSFVPVMRPQ